MDKDTWIRASEIADYVYCHRAWWLRWIGEHHSQNIREIEMGITHHANHNRQVKRVEIVKRIAYIVLALAAALFFYSFLSSL